MKGFSSLWLFETTPRFHHFILNFEILVPQSLINVQLYTHILSLWQVLLHFE